MLKDIVFNQSGDRFNSDPIQLDGNCCIYLEFPQDFKGGNIEVLQSSTNRLYTPFLWGMHREKVFDVAIKDVEKGMYIRVDLDHMPTFAKILIPDE